MYMGGSTEFLAERSEQERRTSESCCVSEDTESFRHLCQEMPS
jgi:hypothetical protein